ncbi:MULTISPECIES: Ppx/GppA family phosphatase [Pseudomonadota]|uniref:Ppx/GppA family phosphatase n=1 Tax=Pseudomonadota TaxID=1224 RepID=UPI000769AF5D|nr:MULTISPECIES: Ppx/GppA family phosphatase [Pseudomonadota]
MNFFIRKQNQPVHLYRTAIIDIGSNSVRLVVFSGPRRNPALIFNEKVMAGLGRSLAETGMIDEPSMARAIQALERFRIVAREMDVDETVCVATAAVRDAGNGEEFTRKVEALGLDITILSGDDEARTAGLGVISAIPDADGIVGDLGGGSLDLARVAGGEVLDTATLPLGVLRAAAIRRGDSAALSRTFKKMVAAYPWLAAHPGKPFYLVGGSWRAFGRLDMHLTAYPLKVLHQYRIDVARPEKVLAGYRSMERDALRQATGLAPSRIETLPDAIALLRMMRDLVKPSAFVLSSFGLREGLLYARMDPEVRQRDPLLVATERFGQLQSRFGEDARPLFDWISPVFGDDPSEWQRWLMAACHLSDVAWQASPDFRAERGLEIALHGNWVGIDVIGRSMIGQALYTNFGGGPRPFPLERHVASDVMLSRAIGWGLAMRLAQRLAAGTHDVLRRSRLQRNGDALELVLEPRDKALMGEVVERRHRRLAQFLGLRAVAI